MAEPEETSGAWRQRLDHELALQDPPPLTGLVERSLVRGRRLRRRRTIRRTGLGLAAMLVVSLGVWNVTPRLLAAPMTELIPAESGSATPPAQSTVDLEPATSAAMAVLLRELLPSGYAMGNLRTAGATGDPSVVVDVNDGQGDGMLTVRLTPGGFAGDRCVTSECYPVPGGTVAIDRHPDNCVQALLVSADRKAGTVVSVQVSSCLAWDGTSNPAGRMVLTERQAMALAGDRRWGLRMDRALVEAGRREFPGLAAGQGS